MNRSVQMPAWIVRVDRGAVMKLFFTTVILFIVYVFDAEVSVRCV